MYDIQMIIIETKPSDFKVCKKCKCLNWYENEDCVRTDCDGTEFDESEEAVNRWVKEEYEFWQEEEGYTEEEVESLYVEV